MGVLTSEDQIIRTQKGNLDPHRNQSPYLKPRRHLPKNVTPSVLKNKDDCRLKYDAMYDDWRGKGCKDCSKIKTMCSKQKQYEKYCNEPHVKYDKCKKEICAYWDC